MDFSEIEFNPAAAGLALLGGFLSLFVMKNVEVSIIWKILSLILTTIVCYFMVSFMQNK